MKPGATASRLAATFWGAAPAPAPEREPPVVVHHALLCLRAFEEGRVLNERTGGRLTLMELLADLGIEEDLVYASPELVRGETLDERSLVFTIGVLIFERLTDRHPFGTTEAGRLARLRRGEMGSGVNYFPSVPKELRTILMRAMGPFPEERFAGLDTLRSHLARFVGDPALAATERGLEQPRRRPRFLEATTPVRRTVVTPDAERSTPGVQGQPRDEPLRPEPSGRWLSALRKPRFFDAVTVAGEAPVEKRGQRAGRAPAAAPHGARNAPQAVGHPPLEEITTLDDVELLEVQSGEIRSDEIPASPPTTNEAPVVAEPPPDAAPAPTPLSRGPAPTVPVPDAAPARRGRMRDAGPTVEIAGTAGRHRIAPLLYVGLGAALASVVFVLLVNRNTSPPPTEPPRVPDARTPRSPVAQPLARERADAAAAAPVAAAPATPRDPAPAPTPAPRPHDEPPDNPKDPADNPDDPPGIAAGQRIAAAIRPCGLRPDGRAMRVGVYLRKSNRVLRTFVLPLPWLKRSTVRCIKQRVTRLTLPLDVRPGTFLEWRIRLLAHRAEVSVLKPKGLR